MTIFAETWYYSIYRNTFSDINSDVYNPNDTVCSPIKSIQYEKGMFTATIRVIRYFDYSGYVKTHFYPCEQLTAFERIENAVRSELKILFKLQCVLMKEAVRYRKDVIEYVPDTLEEVALREHTNAWISLYNFNKDNIKDVKTFLKYFKKDDDNFVRLSLINMNIESFSEIPDIGIKFEQVSFDNKPDYSSKIIPVTSFKKFGSCEHFLLDSDYPHSGIIIFNKCVDDDSIEIITQSALSKEHYRYDVYKKDVIIYNPYIKTLRINGRLIPIWGVGLKH